MTRYWIPLVSILALWSSDAFAEPIPPSRMLNEMQVQGAPLEDAINPIVPLTFDGIGNVPVSQLLDIAQQPVRDLATFTRSAKDAEIYRTVAPSVVEVRTKDALGSGSLVSSSGEIITNWHVVAGNAVVAIVYKPAVEGTKPGPNEMKLGRVVKYDEVRDLALVKADEIPGGRIPVRTRRRQ